MPYLAARKAVERDKFEKKENTPFKTSSATSAGSVDIDGFGGAPNQNCSSELRMLSLRDHAAVLTPSLRKGLVRLQEFDLPGIYGALAIFSDQRDHVHRVHSLPLDERDRGEDRRPPEAGNALHGEAGFLLQDSVHNAEKLGNDIG